MLSRRRLLAGTACLAAGALISRSSKGSAFTRALGSPAEPESGRTVAFDLIAAERPGTIPCFAGKKLPMWTFSDDWLPVIRVDLGDRIEARLDNRLSRQGEHTSVHWHGIRLPNGMDGVPYLVQEPVLPGETFSYSFTPPDPGTFFFHTHCNTAEQLGRGLAGILIVDGDTTTPYAADETLYLRDWNVEPDRQAFRSFFTKRGAARAGTYGNVRSVNGITDPEIRLPASSDCRLRLINSDPTRVMEIAVADAETAVIAIDGIAVAPFPFTTWLMAPGTRLDLVVRAPAEDSVARIIDQRLGEVVTLARLIGTGSAPPAPKPFDPAPLRASHIPEPRLADAERLEFVFAAAGSSAPVIAALSDPLSAIGLGSLCLSANDFWTINDIGWPSGDPRMPRPLAVLERGRSYRFSLKNGSQLMHPIHIHGHSFKLLGSDKRTLPVHHSDTILLTPGETIEAAFVADNPGRWMLHCHVIEHQESGMMASVEVV